MFEIKSEQLEEILFAYNIKSPLKGYHYERETPDSKEVCFIIRTDLEDKMQDLIEVQSTFARSLYDCSIATQPLCSSNGER